VPRPLPKKISQIKPTISQVATSSHFLVEFGGLNGKLQRHLKQRGMDSRYITETIGLLCCRASLPGSGFATADIVGKYQGVAEKFAHTRTFVQIDMDFYVDTGYKSLKFLEHWMEFMSSGSETGGTQVGDDVSPIGADPLVDGFHFRMRYPNEYKCDETRIIKFERDYKRYIEYRFFGLFPISLNATPVSYEGSQILKATASFHYDRYYSGQSRSVDAFLKQNGNKKRPASSGTTSQQQTEQIYGRLNSAINTNDSGINPFTSTLLNAGSDALFNFGFNSKDAPYQLDATQASNISQGRRI
jgi:hypothetical protein